MKQDALSRWLKGVLIVVAIIGLFIYGMIIPYIGKNFVEWYPEMKSYYIPWLVFSWISGIPIYIAIGSAYSIAVNIGKNRSFCIENADTMKKISILALIEAGYLFAGNVVLLLLNMNHPGVLLLFLFAVAACVAVAVVAAILSHLFYKAAGLQQENELTI